MNKSVIGREYFIMKGSSMIYLKSNIAYLMKKKDISKYRLCKDCGFGRSMVYRFINTECMDITVKTLIKLAEYFGVSIDDLVYKDLGKNGRYDTDR